MLKKNNKERAISELRKNKIESIFNIIPNLSDKTLDYVEEKYKISNLINETFDSKKKYNTDISPALLLLSGVQARMKQQFSITELNLALTSKKVIENINTNIYYDPKMSILKEANIRSMLKKYEQEEIKEKKQKARKNGIKNKFIISNVDINFNNYFISYFNEFTKKLLEVSQTKCNIHIWDCSILDVNMDNELYEGSTITYKGGKYLRGYKIGSLRGITPNGGITEEICMNTAKKNDLQMSKETLINSEYLKEGHHLLIDRGFLDIDLFRELIKKGIFIVIPVKKNMELYQEAVKLAIENNDWKEHPNKKRKGQMITLVKSLEMTWLSEKEQSKKPTNIKLDYKINCCVIRLDIAKNKDILTDEEIIYSNNKYAYIVIITNDTSLDCSDIIRMYEFRTEIEEDYRQLKDFWGLNIYKSTQYHIISFIILISLLGYNFYQLYIESDEGKEYIGKSFIVEERHGLYIVKGVRKAIVTEHYFGIFEEDEILDIYANLNSKERVTFKEYLID